MAESVAPHPPLRVEQYLELERDAPVRHEFVGGKLYAMSGDSRRHNRIAGNIYIELRAAASGTACRVYMSDMKVQTADEAFYYPDVMVACEAEPDDPYLEHAPCVVVEVVSPSTEMIDRREKLAAYKRMPSLRAYLIVDQDSPRVERHFRDETGQWLQSDVIGTGAFPVPCVDTELTLLDIYDGP